MADNSADFTRKILVDVELKSEQLKNDLPAIIGEIDRLTQSQKAAQKAGETATTAYINNAAQLRNLKAEVRDTNKYIDNVAKAVNAETGSIQQNRAVLSLVTSDYVKLSQVEGQTAASTVKLGTNINTLTTKLKEQEKQIGQNYRNVGNYHDSIKGLLDELAGANPIFQQFGAGLQQVVKVAGFLPSAGQGLANGITSMFKGQSSQNSNQQGITPPPIGFKNFSNESNEATAAAKETELAAEGAEGAVVAEGAAAEGAAGAMTGLGLAMTAVLGVLAALVIPLLALIEYLKDVAGVTDGLSNKWAGLKSATTEFFNTIRAGDWANLNSNMVAASAVAQALNQEIIDLNRNMMASDVATAEENDFISLQMLKLRNIHTTADQATKIFSSVQKTADEQYKRTLANATEGYRTYAAKIANSADAGAETYKKLIAGGVAYANELKKQNKSISDDDIKAFKEFKLRMIEADGIHLQTIQRAQNRDEQRVSKEQAKETAAEQKAEALKERRDAAEAQAENLLQQSLSKQLQYIYESYGQQIVAADQTYNDQLTKLKVFLAKKLISQAEYNRVEAQLTQQHTADITKLIEDFRKNDAAAFMASAQQLTDLQNSLIKNDLQRTIAGIKEKTLVQIEAMQESNADILKTISQLQNELKNKNGKFSADELKELQDRLDIETGLYLNNKDKVVAINEQQAEQIKQAKETAQQKAQGSQDTAAVIRTKQGSQDPFSAEAKNHLAATFKQIDDEYSYRLKKAQEAGEDTSAIYAQWGQATLDASKAFANKKLEYEIQVEQTVQQGAYNIVKQGIQQELQSTLNSLEVKKSNELNNQSLTNTQKLLINNKYKKQEDAAKLKAFKENQKLQVANVLINGAVAIIKTISDLGFVPAIPFVALTAAATALSVGQILSAKPGFAQGGTFESDGKGAILPGYSHRDNTNATLRSGEAVVVSEAMRVPWARNTVSKINEMFGGRSFAVSGAKPAFALGGLFTDGGNANRYFSNPVNDSQGMANTLAYQLINNFPNIYVDVKDVNNQQGILAQTNNRVVL